MRSSVVQRCSLLFVAVLICVGGSPVTSEAAEVEEVSESVDEPDSAGWAVELGGNVRTDFGVRAIRVDVAWRMPGFRALLVVDPMFWTDGRTSTDVLGFWRTGGFEPFGGWRLHTLPLVEGAQLQHNLVVGTAVSFPDFFDGRIGGQCGIEMAMMMVKHGGGVEGDRFRADSGRHYLDRVNFGMFARFHYNLEVR